MPQCFYHKVENLVRNFDCTKKSGGKISAKILKLSSNVVVALLSKIVLIILDLASSQIV